MTTPGSNFYSVEYLDGVIKEDIKKLPTSAKQLVKRAIEERLMIDPIAYGKPLRHSFSGHRRLRVSDYRVIYRIEEDKKNLLVVGIKHRKDVYKL